MADQILSQNNFSAGIFRGREAPDGSVYDAINALVNDERDLFRRGGSAYKSNAPSDTGLWGLIAAHLPAVDESRLLFSSDTSLYVLDADDATPVQINSSEFRQCARAVGAGGFIVIPSPSSFTSHVQLYGGSRKTGGYATGTVTVTNGSATVTGVGTSWLANADAGMVLTSPVGASPAVVRSVDSDTQLTLLLPWSAPTAAGAGYFLAPVAGLEVGEINTYAGPDAEVYVASVGVPARLLLIVKGRVYFTEPGGMTFTAENYHELPGGAFAVGGDAIGDTALIFTTSGVWTIANMNFDPLDDAGNIQHTVSQISKDVILWGDPGIAGWMGGLVVPAIDDVYLLGMGGPPEPISQAIRPLYRGYVEAGYQPGTAAVYRGHYLLPVMNGTTLVDVLVCRLDRDGAWTRWANHAAGAAYAVRVGSTTRAPKLFGINGQRVTDLTGCFSPEASNDDDADGTDHQFTVETRDFDLIGSNRRASTAEKAEVVYELDGTGCTVALSWSSGEEGSGYTALTAIRGGGESDGSGYSVWAINKARRSVRLKIVQSGAAAKMILRRVALRVRKSGV